MSNNNDIEIIVNVDPSETPFTVDMNNNVVDVDVPDTRDDEIGAAIAALENALETIEETVEEKVEEWGDELTATATTLPAGSSATVDFENKNFAFGLPKGDKGDTGATGQDGFSPSATASKVGSTATITITDKDGTTTASISDGVDGTDGQDGADGFSPTATVSKVGDTATISITDKNGTTTSTISDGADGQDGQDGADGADGYSPSATVSKVGTTATITITDKDGTTTAEIHDGGASAFVAEFGITTYADVKDAYDNDAILICTVDDSGNTVVLQLVYFDATNEIFYFAEPNGDGWYWTELSNANGWDDGTRYLASTDVATQLADGLMSALDKQKLDGLSKRNIWYGTCSTSASSSPKAITTASGDFSLTAGNMLVVLFSHANSLSSASLQVDGGASKSAYPMDGTSDISNRWGSNELVMFAYDGTKFIMLEQGKASTTAYGITKLNNTVTSTSTSEAATANAVKSAYDNGGVQSVNGSTGAVSLSIHNVPSGGTSGQVLSKASGTDYDLAWSTPSSGSVTDVKVDGTSVVTGGVASVDLTGKSDVGHTHTKSAITDFPTTVSSFTNDAGYITGVTSTDTPTADTVAEFDGDAHMNSTDMTSQEVSDFVDGLDGQGANLADYVVEQGASGSWTYRKWNSGIYECWIRTANGSAVTIYYPITFTELPRIVATSASTASASNYGTVNVFTRGITVSKVDICFQSNVASADIWADVYVIGKWK